MAMGTRRRRPRQASMWVAAQDPHPFYTRLNQILETHDFDASAEGEGSSALGDARGASHRSETAPDPRWRLQSRAAHAAANRRRPHRGLQSRILAMFGTILTLIGARCQPVTRHWLSLRHVSTRERVSIAR